jgi:hypothetical protein
LMNVHFLVTIGIEGCFEEFFKVYHFFFDDVIGWG